MIFLGGLLRVITKKTPKKSVALMEMILEGVKKLRAPEKAELGLGIKRRDLGNKFLESRMKAIGGHWTTGENGSPVNLYLLEGTLLVCASGDSKEAKLLEKVQGLSPKPSTQGGAKMWTYQVKSTGDLDVLLRKIMSLSIKPNLYVS